jgi:SAM-dependent methyltransferase
MVWRIDDPQGDEAGKVKYLVVPYTRGAVLDMGCGPSKAFPHFIGVDDCKDTALFGIPIKPDVLCNVADPQSVADTFEPGSCDAIFSSHCLEHIDDHRAALRAWWNILKPGGHLCLYLPHRDLYPNIGTDGANPDHKHDFVAHGHHLVHGRHRGALRCRGERNARRRARVQLPAGVQEADRALRGHLQLRRPPSPKRPCALCATGASAT